MRNLLTALNGVLPKHLLPIIPAGLTVLEVMPMPDLLTITTSPRQKSAPCPTCGEPSPRIHSRYLRQLHDLPWQGRAVTAGFKPDGSAARTRRARAAPLPNTCRRSPVA